MPRRFVFSASSKGNTITHWSSNYCCRETNKQTPLRVHNPIEEPRLYFWYLLPEADPKTVPEYLPVYLSNKSPSQTLPPEIKHECQTLAEKFGPTNPCANTVDTEPFPTTVLKAIINTPIGVLATIIKICTRGLLHLGSPRRLLSSLQAALLSRVLQEQLPAWYR